MKRGGTPLFPANKKTKQEITTEIFLPTETLVEILRASANTLEEYRTSELNLVSKSWCDAYHNVLFHQNLFDVERAKIFQYPLISTEGQKELFEQQTKEISSFIKHKDAILAKVQNDAKIQAAYLQLENIAKEQADYAQLKDSFAQRQWRANSASLREKILDEINESIILFVIELAKKANIARVDFSSCFLTRFPARVIDTPQLATFWEKILDLDMNLNLLTFLPYNIGKLKNLQALYLYDNQLSILPESMKQLHSLTFVDLRDNRFTIFPDVLCELSAIEIIWMSYPGNRVKTLPIKIGQLKTLKELSIDNNLLEALPQSIKNLNNLKRLSVSDNCITELSEELAQLPSLEINVTKNSLSTIPECLHDKLGHYGIKSTPEAVLETQINRDIAKMLRNTSEILSPLFSDMRNTLRSLFPDIDQETPNLSSLRSKMTSAIGSLLEFITCVQKIQPIAMETINNETILSLEAMQKNLIDNKIENNTLKDRIGKAVSDFCDEQAYTEDKKKAVIETLNNECLDSFSPIFSEQMQKLTKDFSQYVKEMKAQLETNNLRSRARM